MDLDPSLIGIASELFAQRGIDFNAARRAGGWTNAKLKFAFGPSQLQDTLLQRAAQELAAPALASPTARERLFGYAILLELWLLEDWLAHPEGEGPLETWDPYRRLLSLAEDRGGYLAGL